MSGLEIGMNRTSFHSGLPARGMLASEGNQQVVWLLGKGMEKTKVNRDTQLPLHSSGGPPRVASRSWHGDHSGCTVVTRSHFMSRVLPGMEVQSGGAGENEDCYAKMELEPWDALHLFGAGGGE
jgi:hypothetical protein